MELTFKDLRKRDVVNLSDGKSLGNITNISLSFPKGTMTGITVPGKKVNFITRIFSRGLLYIPDEKIIRIGNDVILVDLKCGDYCAESTNLKNPKKPCSSPCDPCPPPRFTSNGGLDSGKFMGGDDDFS